jgi:hypothetical protein
VQINLKTTGVPADFATSRDGMKLEDVYTNYFTIALTPNALMSRTAINYLPKYYFFAIPTSAIDNNPLLKQNDGWTNGAFNPLE